MGCCFSLKMSGGPQGERSGLLQSPHHDVLSEVTEELRQHAAAVAQHVRLDEESEEESGGTCEEKTRVFHTNMDAETSVTRGAGPAPRSEENPPDGSERVWSPLSDMALTEASGDRRGPEVDGVVETDFRAKTRSFYSLCSIDTDDLEQDQPAAAAAGAAALLQALTWRRVEEAPEQAGPVLPQLADPPSDPLEEPSGHSPHADVTEDPPGEPPVTPHTAQGAREGGSEGLHTQREEDLGRNLGSGSTDDHLGESEPSAVQRSGSFPPATPSREPEPSAQSSSVTFWPPHPNRSPSPPETGPASPQGALVPVVEAGEGERQLSEQHRAPQGSPRVSAAPARPLGDANGPNPGQDGQDPPPAGTFPDQTGPCLFGATSDGCRADPALPPEDPGQVDAHASTPSYLIHPPPPEQGVAAVGGGRMREMVSELLGDRADLPVCHGDPEPWIRLGLGESRRAWAQGWSQSGSPPTGGEAEQLQASMALLGANPGPRGACVWDWHTQHLNPEARVWNNPDFGPGVLSPAQQEPQRLWTPFSTHLSGFEGARLRSEAFPCLSPCEVTVRPDL